jgi:hypothetical protein
MECKTCGTHNNFKIFAYDRLGNPTSERWEALLTCNQCASSVSLRLEGFKYEKDFLKHLRKITRPGKGQTFVQEVWAYNWTDGGYDFSKKHKVISNNNS